MQMLHPHCGSIQQYMEELPDADRYRPSSCPLCEAKRPLIAHGFYSRTLVDVAFDGVIRVRRYLCRLCRRGLRRGGVGQSQNGCSRKQCFQHRSR